MVPIITDPSLTLDPTLTFTTCTTTPHEVYATASSKPWHRHKSKLKKKLNLRGGKREPRRNKTRMWGLTPVRSFSVSSLSWSHIFKAASSHREAGSSTCKINLADAASHSRSHPSLSMLQYSSTALVVPSSQLLK